MRTYTACVLVLGLLTAGCATTPAEVPADEPAFIVARKLGTGNVVPRTVQPAQSSNHDDEPAFIVARKLGTGDVAPRAAQPAQPSNHGDEPAFLAARRGGLGAIEKPTVSDAPPSTYNGPNPGGVMAEVCGRVSVELLRAGAMAVPISAGIAGVCLPLAAGIAVIHIVATKDNRRSRGVD